MKRQPGYITVEATFLILIFFAITSVLFSVGIVFEKNMILYSAVEASSERASEAFYIASRISSGLTEDGIQIDTSDKSHLTQILSNKMSAGIRSLSGMGISQFIVMDLSSQMGGEGTFLDNCWLDAMPTFRVSTEENAIIIDSTQVFKVRGIFPVLGNMTFKDRHIIPLKGARTLVEGSDITDMTTVYVTNHGKSTTHVYHTSTTCFGCRFAKGFDTFQVESSLLGGNLALGEGSYHLCRFCAKGKMMSSSETKRGVK